METKKDIVAYCNQLLYYFKKMWEFGGSYNEKPINKNEIWCEIEFKYSNGIIILFPLTEKEYDYWRSIKPKLLKGDRICQ